MRTQLLAFCAFAALAITAAPAQQNAPKGKFYVDWDDAAKKCIVVTEKPTLHDVAGGGPFNTRAEALAAFKKIKGCS